MPAFHINSFKGGLSDYNKAGIKGSFQEGSSGLDIRKYVDSLSCGLDLLEIGAGVIDQDIYWLLPEGTYIFAVGRTKIFRITVADETVTEVYSGGTNITGAKMVYHNSEKLYIYWADNQYLHRKEYPGLSNWSDVDADAGWPKSDLDQYLEHPMEEVGGSLLIGNGSKLAYVGYDESYSNEVTRLPLFNIITSILDRGGQAVLGTRQLNANGIDSMVDFEVPIFVGNGGIYYSDFVKNVPAKKFPGLFGRVLAGAISVGRDTAFTQFLWQEAASADPDVNSWLTSSFSEKLAYLGYCDYNGNVYSGLYSLGRNDKNKPFVLNCDINTDYYVNSLIKYRYLGYLEKTYISLSDDNLYVVKSGNNRVTGTYIGLDLQVPDKLPSQITNWKFAELVMKPLPVGTSIDFYYKLDRDGDYIQADLQDGTTNFDNTGETRAVFKIAEKADVFTPKIVLNPNGSSTPEIYDIYIHFE